MYACGFEICLSSLCLLQNNQVVTPREYTRDLHLILTEINWINVFFHKNFLEMFAWLYFDYTALSFLLNNKDSCNFSTDIPWTRFFSSGLARVEDMVVDSGVGPLATGKQLNSCLFKAAKMKYLPRMTATFHFFSEQKT